MPHAMIVTYGCQMSEHDSEIMSGILQENGFVLTDDESEADVIIVNTCCVRKHAEDRIYGYVNSLKFYQTKKPELLIGVSGCLAQNEKEGILKHCPHVSFIMGTQDVPNVLSIVEKAASAKGRAITGGFQDGKYVPAYRKSVRKNTWRAWISIMKGCENYCSYCIVPFVRGKEVSRSPKEIMEEIEFLSEQGYREIILLGQNVNSYGAGLKEKTDFLELLKKIDDRHCVPWIRYTTSHPRDFSEELISFIRNSATICTNFHLPVQAGADRVLDLMNRKYTVEHYMKLVQAIKREFQDEDYTITTDIICGFPGETEEEFEQTLELVKTVRYDGIFSFFYSPRSGTAAEKLPGLLPEPVRKKRLTRLIELIKPIVLERNKERIGKEFRVFVEGFSGKSKADLQSRTRSNKIVLFPGPPELIGKFVRVEVTEALQWVLKGKLISLYENKEAK